MSPLWRKWRQPRSQEVTVDARPGTILVIPWLATNGPMRLGTPLKLDPATPAAELGAAVEAALGESTFAAMGGGDPLEPVLRAAGVRSWSAYVKGLQSVAVSREDGRVTVIPQRSRGARAAVSGMPEQAECLESPSAEELGAAVRRALKRAEASGKAEAAPPTEDECADDYMVGFGRKAAWLAMRSERPDEVVHSLGLSGVREVSWREGLDEIERQEHVGAVFVTPPVCGWTLAVLGVQFADGQALDLERLSREFGEVQRFASHRVSDYYEWQRWVDGRPVRRYAWVGDRGEIPFDDGEPAAAEAGIARLTGLRGDWDGLQFPDEDTVLNVAAEWSVDPSTIDDGAAATKGLLGYRSR